MSDWYGIMIIFNLLCLKLIIILFAQGSETDIRAKFYSMAFQQQYEEETSSVHWKVVDYEFAGDVPYY
jgi:hypothetical protein